jgi:hypothetical protein
MALLEVDGDLSGAIGPGLFGFGSSGRDWIELL